MPSKLTRLAGPFVAVGVAAMAGLSGCSTATTATGSPPSTSMPTTSTPTSPPASTSTSAPRDTRGPGESQGAYLFRTQCAGCHGTNGEGNLGPTLVGIADRMTEADQLALVRSGRGRMPPFTPGLDAADIAAVVDYTRTSLH